MRRQLIERKDFAENEKCERESEEKGDTGDFPPVSRDCRGKVAEVLRARREKYARDEF